jgi:uncharacterized protein (TIGR02246 family)
VSAEQLGDRWVDAFNRADVDALARLYTDDILFFGSLPDLYVGHAGVRDYLASVLPAGVQVQLVDRRFVDVADGIVAMSGLLNGAWASGERRQYRLTWTLVERDGDWLIALHHGSLRPA